MNSKFNMRKSSQILIISIFLVIINISFFSNIVYAENIDNIGNVNNVNNTSNTVNKSNQNGEENSPNINSHSALLIYNKDDGKNNYEINPDTILYKKNENEKMYPASTTKIVTAILVLENHNLNEKVTASYDALMSIPSGYSTANIQVGEELTVQQLLELLLVHSANDAANVLAEYTGGSIKSFVTMMNTKVDELNLKNTHFTNPYGLQEDDHYTTAHDLAVIMKYCLKNEDFRKIAGQASCTIPATNLSGPRKYNSTNELLIADNSNYYPNLIAGKTGYTEKAGGCLVSVAYDNNLELIGVVLNSNNRFSDTKNLYNYGFKNFSLKNIIKKDDIITKAEIKNATNDTKNLNLLATNDIQILAKNSEDLKNLEPHIELNSDIIAPIEEGQTLGKATYTIDGNNYETNLVAANSVKKSKKMIYILTVIGIIILFIFILVIGK